MGNVIILPSGQLADKVISDIQIGLADTIDWLTNVYGRAERLTEYRDNKQYYTPGVYSNNLNDYIPLYPDSRKGNFCFFYMYDPQLINWVPKGYGVIKVPIALIFWFDLREVNNSLNVRNTENLKAEVLNSLNGGFAMPNGRIEINKAYNLNENIYRDFSITEIDNQYLMHPYGGFRLEGELFIEQPCYNI